MGKNEKNSTSIKFKPPVIAIAGILVLMVFIMSGITLSGYTTSAKEEDVVQIAAMLSDVTVLVNKNLPAEPGSVHTIPVEVTNFTEQAIKRTVCEVAQSYELKLADMAGNLPLYYEIFSDSSLGESSLLAAGSYGNEIKVSGILPASEITTHNYWVRVTWPKEHNDLSYAYEIDAFNIRVEIEQMD